VPSWHSQAAESLAWADLRRERGARPCRPGPFGPVCRAGQPQWHDFMAGGDAARPCDL